MEKRTEQHRVKKTTINLAYGSVSQALRSFWGFLVRIVLVRTLGLEATSLNGLFTDIIVMLSLAEMGIGQVIVYNLYVPLLNKDEKKLTELMNLFKTAYRLVALVIFSVGLALTPFVHLLINKVDIDLGYLRLIYILYVLHTAVSYLFSYKQSLLSADQKYYVVSKYSLIVKSIFSIITIIALVVTRNFLVYIVLQIATSLSTNVAISFVADRLYPFLNKEGKLPKDERNTVLSNIKHLFIGALSTKLTNSTDNILISVLVGTLNIGSYSTYVLLLGFMEKIMLELDTATTGGIGNLMAEGDKEHLDVVMKRLTFINFCPVLIGAVVFFCVSSPLILILFGELYVMNASVVFVCTFNFFLFIVRDPLWQVMRVSGLFAKDKNTSLAGSVVNLIVSVILGLKLGVLGVLLGTTCTHIVLIILKSIIVYKDFFCFSGKSFNILFLKYGICCMLSLLAVGGICSLINISNLYVVFLVRGLISFVLACLILLIFFGRTDEFKYALKTGRQIALKFIKH